MRLGKRGYWKGRRPGARSCCSKRWLNRVRGKNLRAGIPVPGSPCLAVWGTLRRKVQAAASCTLGKTD
ncbi:MAG: hypothetical protein ATN36_09100 [Epulopiscium sp. Nele67-Bin005]|nr:MAG: hypothetical protein ATN36_09100 [Epulopiscium sp. Nele67-Bin005]